MQKRKSHHKSRRGCQNCKQRHVKCDEQGPPCANCVVRRTACVYPRSRSAAADENSSVAPSGSDGTSNGRQASPSVTSDASGAQRLLELELMHRWATSTYKTLCSLPEDEDVMQVTLPREALRHGFLLNGILALAALDLAISPGAAVSPHEARAYIHAGLEYYDRASAAYRAQLGDITRENYWLLHVFSSMAATISITMPRCALGGGGGDQSILGCMPMLFDLLLGSVTLAIPRFNWLLESPMTSLRKVLAAEKPSPDLLLDDDTKAALARLTTVSDEFDAGSDEVTPSGVSLTCAAYKVVIRHLTNIFAEEVRAQIRWYCVSFPGFAGKDFALAMRASDPMALFILMHWGVLFDRVGTGVWWAMDVGRGLVAEISEIIQQSRLGLIPAGGEGISWARRQVDLPPLL